MSNKQIEIGITYEEFLKSKLFQLNKNEITDININSKLFDFQRYAVELAYSQYIKRHRPEFELIFEHEY